MKLIVGLGNPGKEYAATRHNVGFMVVDAIAGQIANGVWQMDRKFSAEYYKPLAISHKLLLVKPKTFMNNSGVAVSKIMAFYKLDPGNLCVCHDDLDIEMGKFKLQCGVGPKVHNGLKSIEESLGSKDFWRARIGIAGEHYQMVKNRGGSISEDYVLKPFSYQERAILNPIIEEVIAECLRTLRA